MKNFKKPLLFAAILIVLFSLSACSSRKTTDAPVEAIFPKDATFIVMFDYSDENQVENFKNLMKKFPKIALKEKFIEGFDSKAKKNDLLWQDDIAPIFDEEWKMGVSVSFKDMPSIKSPEDFEKLSFKDVDFYFAGKFSESDKIRDLFDNIIDNGSAPGLKYEKINGVDYWINEDSEAYVVLYGDLFFVTNSKERMDAAIKRIETGGGFNGNEKFALKANNMASKSLGYIFVDSKFLSGFYNDLLTVMKSPFVEWFDAIGDSFIFWSVESDGFRIVSSSSFDLKSEFFKKMLPNSDYKVSLIDKVNGEGVFLYVENAGFGSLIDMMMQSFKSFHGFSTSNNIDPFGSVVDKIDSFVKKIRVLLDSPVAFVMSDFGSVISTVSLYFQLKDNTQEEAKKIIQNLDSYVDEIIAEIDKTNEITGAKSSLLKKSVEVVDGGALHRVYVDWNAFSEEDKEKFKKQIPVVGLNNFKVEFYYGLTGDNVFVLAFYPDFPKAYGKNVLSQNKDYQEAMGKLNGAYGLSVTYFSTAPFINWLQRIFDMYGAMGIFPKEAVSVVDLYLKHFWGTVKYIVSSTALENDTILQSIFVKIEEVK